MKRASAFGETEVLYFFAKFALATCSLHVRFMFASCSLYLTKCSLHVLNIQLRARYISKPPE